MVLQSAQLLFQHCILMLWVVLEVGVHLENGSEGVDDRACGDYVGESRALGECHAW